MLRSIKITISLFLIFTIHRIAAWQPLSATFNSPNLSILRDGLTGSLSDFWIATLLSLPFWLFEFTTRRFFRKLQRFLAFWWVLLWSFLTASHQAYVEFFKFQIIPFHLDYLLDRSFIESNGQSIFGTAPLVLLAVGLWASYWIRRAKRTTTYKQGLLLLMAVILLSLAAHTTNIHWRVNWFVLEPLQTHYLESLYSNIQKKPSFRPILDEERKKLAETFHLNDPLKIARESKAPIHPLLEKIRSEVQKKVLRRSTVYITVILAESLREFDTGPREGDQESLTKNLDRLKKNGVSFTQAYSTGPVTRGGQEAVWCGTPSSIYTSLMRSYPNAPVQCLPKIYEHDPKVRTLWLHGGDDRFDSQRIFWTNQGVGEILSKGYFSPDSPQTDWGISDLALFDRSISILQKASSGNSLSFVLPMILTVTNHIPWDLPSDASIDTRNFIPPHPQHKTVRYFDESLDLFVGSLKQRGLWANSILIIVGDHGNLEPTWRPYPNEEPLRWERMLSHISLTLTGGIIEDLRYREELPSRVDEITSQAQIAPFILALTEKNLNSATGFDLPLFEKSPWPVTSDLNQYLYVPELSQKIPKEKALSGSVDPQDQRAWLSALRYRAWIDFLYSSH